jgi:hypothetical protein
LIREKKIFIQGYIDKLTNELEAFNKCEPEQLSQAERNLFDIILEIRNVFLKEMPEIEDMILIRNGTGVRDAKSVIGKLSLYLISESEQDDNEISTGSTIKGVKGKLDDAFISYASEILADTNHGMSGAQIVKYSNSYAIDFGVNIPITSSEFGKYGSIVPNKRTALYKNLRVFDAVQQFTIIKDLCEIPLFAENDTVKDLKIKLYTRYGNLAIEKIAKTELVIKTRHWLENHSKALEQYNNSLAKYEGGIFERNTLDDIRLAFELLVKDLLENGKSLENNIAELGAKLKEADTSVELRNMCTQIIKYYTDFQNNHVKHNDKVNENEIEYIIEQTSIVMKFLIKTIGGTR